MLRLTSFSLVLFTVVVLGCGSPRPDDLVKQSIRQWEEAADLLESAAGPASLEEIGKKLDDLAERMAEVNKKAARLEIDPAERGKLDADNRGESQAALRRFNTAARKFSEIPGGPAILGRFQRNVTWKL